MVHFKSFILPYFSSKIVHGNNEPFCKKAFTIKLYQKFVCVRVFPFSKINVQMLNVSKLDSVAKDVKLIKDCITHRMLFGCNGMHTDTRTRHAHIDTSSIFQIFGITAWILIADVQSTFFIDMFDHRNLFAFAIHGAEEKNRKIIHSISA